MAMTSFSGTAIGTTANLVATAAANGGSGNLLPKMWKKGADLAEQGSDFFQEFEGKGMRSPIRVETDFGAGRGQKIVFRTRTGLYGDGAIGDETSGDKSEEMSVRDYEMEVDFIRHSTEHNIRTEEQTALDAELNDGVNVELGEWMGRKKTSLISMMFREKLHATSRVFAGAVGSIDAIKTAHAITVNGLTDWSTILETMGGKPAEIAKDPNGNRICKYILVAVNEALVTMKQSSDYKTLVRDAGSREQLNPLFKGGVEQLDGQIIKKFVPLDHDGPGPIGSALGAKALLGVAITAANTVQEIKGGGNATNAAKANAKYFEFFPLYAYRFTPADILSNAGSSRYVLIYNISGADAGKMGFYSFSANDGNKLTMDARLRASASGAAVTTLGGVVWNTGVWVGKHTDAHPVGSVIIETNSFGVPIGRSFLLGADAAKRGYGKYRNTRTHEMLDGDFFKKTYITTVIGQRPTERNDGRTPNALVITHAMKYAGLSNIPDVV